MTGFYVALEGVEGSGKSTVSALLVEKLAARGIDAVAVREPGGTDLGERLRLLVLHSEHMAPWAEAALFAASRAQLVDEIVGPALKAGRWVISDRSYYSSLAYQGGGRGLGVDEVRILNEGVLAGVVPDLVVVFELDPDIGFARELDRDRMGEAGLEFQRTVASTYSHLVADDPAVVAVDASQTPAEISDQILAIVDAVRVDV